MQRVNANTPKQLGYNWKWFNPVAWHLLSLMRDTSKRLIVLYGGSSSGKSYSVAQSLLIMTMFSADNSIVMRKVGASISKTIYEDFKVATQQLEVSKYFKFKDSVRRIVCLLNGAHIDFAGLDDPEKIKGISNYRWVFMDEWSEFDEVDFKQIRKRLRGKVGQQIITAFNPIKETHWIKRIIFDPEKWIEMPNDVVNGKRSPLFQVKTIRQNEPKAVLNPRTKEVEEHAPDTVIIQSTYLNNFWVVGSPDGRYGYYDEQCVADFEKDRLNDPDYYQVYALGEWGVIRTGSEYFASFNRGKHAADVEYNPDLPIHISVDNNVLPYISVSYWQAEIGDSTHIRQIGETCAGNPDNTARKSAKLVANWLHERGYYGKVYLHGDASTRAANTIDEEKRSFHDLFISSLAAESVEVVDMVGRSNPSTAMSGEFINAIWDGVIDGLNITIGNNCTNSIEDYLSVQKDANGGILKTKVKNKITGQTYEEHGHISDTMRYVVCDILRDEFYKFSNRRKRNLYARDGAIHFYNPATEYNYTNRVVYCMPNIGGKFVMVYGCQVGDRWHIVEAAFLETSSTSEIKNRLMAISCPTTIIECADAYFPFIKELRRDLRIRVMREVADVDRRIAATSDYVGSHVLFDEAKVTDDKEYSDFMNSLLDYRKDGQNKEASAVLSGFIQFVEKSCTSVKAQ